MLNVDQKIVKIAIIGGSGFWSELSHHKHLLELRGAIAIQLVAIIDPVDPRGVSAHANLQTMLSKDNPEWINPEAYNDTDQIMNDIKNRLGTNLVIIASNPCTHFKYGLSCIKQGLNVICDKPIVSHINASIDPSSAQAINREYKELLEAYDVARKNNPSLLFHSILRRRSLEPFTKVADELGRVYRKTGAGINNLSFILNGGIYKLPMEFASSGAHGYLEGVGSVSHSAYHYIDVMSWFLSKAPGRTVKIKPKLNYVLRVGDYLGTKAYEPIAKILNSKPNALSMPKLDNAVLGSELNSGFTFMLYDGNNLPLGEMTFLCSHVSFSPRVNGYDETVHEHANRKGGGRMSHFCLDVHQSGLQNWQITKNDIVFEGNTITVQGRRHPLIEGESYETTVYEKAYEPDLTLKDLLAEVIRSVQQDRAITNHPVIRGLEEERLATMIYGACYELIAHDYIDDKSYESNFISL